MASPLLANIYLHYVFDLWVDAWRKKCAHGDVVVVRYADDNVLGFQHRSDADRFLEAFRERLGKFGLGLHPDKTRLIEFGPIPLAVFDRVIAGTISEAEFDRWLPAFERITARITDNGSQRARSLLPKHRSFSFTSSELVQTLRAEIVRAITRSNTARMNRFETKCHAGEFLAPGVSAAAFGQWGLSRGDDWATATRDAC